MYRSGQDDQGNALGRDELAYRATDTKEVVWRGTWEEIFTWAGSRRGIEPFDRHLAYWERRYKARRFARRLGNLPSYPDLYEAHWELALDVDGLLDATEEMLGHSDPYTPAMAQAEAELRRAADAVRRRIGRPGQRLQRERV